MSNILTTIRVYTRNTQHMSATQVIPNTSLHYLNLSPQFERLGKSELIKAVGITFSMFVRKLRASNIVFHPNQLYKTRMQMYCFECFPLIGSAQFANACQLMAKSNCDLWGDVVLIYWTSLNRQPCFCFRGLSANPGFHGHSQFWSLYNTQEDDLMTIHATILNISRQHLYA